MSYIQVCGTNLKLATGAFSVARPRHYNPLIHFNTTWLLQAGSCATFCNKLKTHFFNLYRLRVLLCFTSFRFYLFYVCTAPLSTCKGRLIKFTTMMMMMMMMTMSVTCCSVEQCAEIFTAYCRRVTNGCSACFSE